MNVRTGKTPATLAEMGAEVLDLVSQRPPAIVTDADLAGATSWLARVRTRRREIEAFFDRLVKPFRAAIAGHKRECDNLLAPLRQHEQSLNGEILRYRNEQNRKAREAQRKLDERYERKVERAEAKGADVSLIKPPTVVATPPRTIGVPGGGSVSFPKHRKFRIVDPELVPDEYWIIDEVKIGKAVRAGIDVPGCLIWQEEGSAVTPG